MSSIHIPFRSRTLVAAVIGLAVLAACSLVRHASPEVDQPYLTVEASGGDPVRFEIEIARSNDELFRGLRFREHLDADKGMLFDLGRVRLTDFTMSDTVIPLDMLFLSREGEIVQIYENTEPLNPGPYSSEIPVRAVLELGGGVAAASGIAVGDRVLHPIFEDAAR